MNQKSDKQIRKFAKAAAKGQSLKIAMLDAGYSLSTARRGKAALSGPMLEALARESAKLEALGENISPERQENLVRGRLVLNTLHGKDEGVQSAKLLGSDRRVSMWEPESRVGVIVLQPPPIKEPKHAVPILGPYEPDVECS